ncbi:hypothetical protein C4B63_7g416 [Trypanosoma cruzi]|uniref:Defective in cullin neddylation protein n=1 Tax=Trypanosoma cruzi TaxID=5693 RepID=A0A2V2VUV4_TRYCR|nr:hypothetical protein C4B63_7g416 [Trypanosoma cruzi]
MPPKGQRSLNIAQPLSSSRAQSANAILRSAASTMATSGPAASKSSPRTSCFPRTFMSTGNARNEMEAYYEQLLSQDRVDGVDAFGKNGIHLLCKGLGIKPESFEMYTLVWKMGVTRGCCIPRADWLKTMYTYKIEQPMDLKLFLVEWVKESRGDSFTEFYNDLYDYIRGEEARLMPYGTAVEAWAVLFQNEPRIIPWIKWYSDIYRREVTRDVWRQIGIFFSAVPNIEAYNVEDRWSCAIDSYVEWCKVSG